MLLADATVRFLEIKAENHFVKTDIYEQARQVLQDQHLVVLTGHPGEGKTTIAANLALEDNTLNKNCVKLECARDWEDVDWSLRIFTTVIIDDMFGGISLDHGLLSDWKRVLPDIEQRAKDKTLKVIITSRRYIIEEAKEDMDKITMFRTTAKCVIHLDSGDLSNNEMKQILESALKRNNIEQHVNLDECVDKARGVLNSELKEHTDCVFGFPECAMLFATETLVRHGSYFFEKPECHFKTYIEQLYKSKAKEQFYKFVALVAVWAHEKQTIKETDLQNPDNVSVHIRNVAECFGITIDHTFVEIVKSSLNAYTRFLLLFITKSGEFILSHNVIGEMIGVVLGKHKPRECIKLCGRDFLMNRVTLSETNEESMTVTIPERMYTDLCEKFANQLVCEHEITLLKHSALLNRTFTEQFSAWIVRHDSTLKLFTTPYPYMYRGMYYVFDFILENDLLLFAESILSQIKRPRIKVNGDSVCVVMRELLPLLGKLIESFEGHCDCECSAKHAKYLKSIAIESPNKAQRWVQYSYPLIVAASENLLDAVTCFLRHGANVNLTDANKMTPLHIAAINNHDQIAQNLLEYKADVKSKDIDGRTPLLHAARQGHSDVIKTCLKHGADLNLMDNKNRTALHYAANSGHYYVIKELLVRKADINACDIYGGTPLHLAARKGHIDVVKTCLHYGAKVHPMGSERMTALHHAADRGHNGVMKELLAIKEDVNARLKNKRTPLHLAARKHHLDVVTTCLDYGAYVDEIDKDHRTALHQAANGGDCTMMMMLLDNKANVNARDCFGRTPLHYAARKTHLDAVIVCLHNGADINLIDNAKRTALHRAASRGSYEVMMVLIKAGTDVNAMDKFGNTPLHITAYRGNTKCVELCLKNGANVSLVDKKHWTVLRCAADRRHHVYSVIVLLLKHADIKTRDLWK